MKRQSMINGIKNKITIGSDVACTLMPSELEAEVLRRIVGGPDSGHEADPFEPNSILQGSYTHSVGIALIRKNRALSTPRTPGVG